MPPTIKDLTAVRGDTLSRTMTAYSASGVVMPLTSCTLWFTVKKATDQNDADDTDAITKCYWISGGASSGISVATPSTGVFAIDAPSTDMAALDPDQTSYIYDVQITDSSARVYTLIKGNLLVLPDVTRRAVAP